LSFRPLAEEQELFGWYLAIGDSPSFSLFVDPQKSVKTIFSRNGKSPKERIVKIDCTLYIRQNTGTVAEKDVIERCLAPFTRDEDAGINATITFDGENFVITEHPAAHSSAVIFKGKAVF
jgi:hypothetical protein